jgi:hypothetical protein
MRTSSTYHYYDVSHLKASQLFSRAMNIFSPLNLPISQRCSGACKNTSDVTQVCSQAYQAQTNSSLSLSLLSLLSLIPPSGEVTNPRQKSKAARKCPICGQPGHFSKTCPQAGAALSAPPLQQEADESDDVIMTIDGIMITIRASQLHITACEEGAF